MSSEIERNRCGIVKTGDTFLVGDIYLSIGHELWNTNYPSEYALLNGACLDCGEGKVNRVDAKCPDGGRVCIHGEVIDY